MLHTLRPETCMHSSNALADACIKCHGKRSFIQVSYEQVESLCIAIINSFPDIEPDKILLMPIIPSGMIPAGVMSHFFYPSCRVAPINLAGELYEEVHANTRGQNADCQLIVVVNSVYGQFDPDVTSKDPMVRLEPIFRSEVAKSRKVIKAALFAPPGVPEKYLDARGQTLTEEQLSSWVLFPWDMVSMHCEVG